MKKVVFILLMIMAGIMGPDAKAREITLLEGPFRADWSPDHYVDPMQLVGVAPGDIIHVYTSNLSDYATAYIRIMGNGWQAISKDFDNIRIYGDFECCLDEDLVQLIDNEILMFGGDGYTIEKVTLITDRPEDTRIGYDELSNPNASQATRQIYNLLRDCYGNCSISSTMAEVDWNYKEAGYVKSWTGNYPAMNGFDFIHLTYDWEPYSDITPVERWWEMGGLVSLCWHWRAPDSESVWKAYKADNNEKTAFEGFYAPGGGTPVTQFSAANAVKEGTWENEFVKADLEKVADRLRLLRDAGIVVIWRPLHEAAGNSTIYNDGKAWFWWGADGAEPCVKLWKMMYDYFSERGLDNLIWVWTSQTKDGAWYPGDEYVDMIGRDLYNYSVDDAAYNFEYLTAYYPHKMLALSECGSAGGSNPGMGEQWDAGAKWSYAMPWYHYQYTLGTPHQYAGKEWWQEWKARPEVIMLDEMRTLRNSYLSSNSVDTVSVTEESEDNGWYTLQGIRISRPETPGIYIHNRKKVVIR